MIDLTCQDCRRRTLVGTRAIEGLTNGPNGIEIDVRCPCGALSKIVTGRAARAQAHGRLRELPSVDDEPEARKRAA